MTTPLPAKAFAGTGATGTTGASGPGSGARAGDERPGAGLAGARAGFTAATEIAGRAPAPAAVRGSTGSTATLQPAAGADQDPGATERGAPAVAVCMVTHDSATDLAGCMASIGALRHRPLEIVVVDSASGDGSLEQARRTAPAGIPLTAQGFAANLGFAAGMNAAIALTTAPFILTLNADARPHPDYLDRLLARFAAQPELRVAAVTGRLIRLAPEPPPQAAAPGGDHEAAGAGGERGDTDRHGMPAGGAEAPPLATLDACGMWLTRSWRHLDRGSGELDTGQWARAERVFGATGAASLFRRAALLDAAIDGEIFDPRFHSFREDAELCFRLRERGWEVLYEPAAVAEHRRFNLPERRAAMPAAVNFHSLKNRYLLRIYHQGARNLARTLLPTLGRDLMALAHVLLRERSSLAAYAWLLRHRAEVLARRRAIQGRRLLPAAELDAWFGRTGAPL